MKTSDFDYALPVEYIAQTPIEPRDSSRLMVLHREEDTLEHRIFCDLGDYLRPGDVLVINETRVIRARLFAYKIPTGGKLEILLLRQLDELTWEALIGGKRVNVGAQMSLITREALTSPLHAHVLEELNGAERLIRFDRPIDPLLSSIGQVPLPPYIHAPLQDPERYQTVYAERVGSAAAPTAGLHFTPHLMDDLSARGIRFAKVTLHIGLDTFAPVTEENPHNHPIHTEWCQVTPDAAETINRARCEGRRIIAVCTTSVRTLESAALTALPGDAIGTFQGPTSLFILPGYTFKATDAMITNFHLPKSTLIMLVSAFAGRERILSAYQTAKELGYRFYSFGDAMLIV